MEFQWKWIFILTLSIQFLHSSYWNLVWKKVGRENSGGRRNKSVKILDIK